MSQPLYPPPGPQSIGRVLDLGFRIFQMSLVSCLIYAALSMIAGQLPNIYFIASGRPLTPFGGGSALWVGLYLVGSFITLLLYGALLFRQHGLAVGGRLGTRTELWRSFRKLPASLGLAFITVVMLVITALIVQGILRGAGIALEPQNYVVILALGLLAAVPLTYLGVALVLAGLSLLLEDTGPWRAFRYTLRLIRGNWWRTAVVLTVAFVLVIVFYGVAMVIVGMVLPLAGARDFAAVTAATGVVYVVLGSIGLPFFSATLLAIYGDLKVRKEGLDLEQRVAGIAQA